MNHPLVAVLGRFGLVAALAGLVGSALNDTPKGPPVSDDFQDPVSRAPSEMTTCQYSFLGVKAGDEREVVEVKLCWCPPGRFAMGSPPGEPERRPGEDQVEVTLSRGFWIGKYEVTQNQWQRRG
jgi:formylglycine-generating enzyme required for sulfatase activity